MPKMNKLVLFPLFYLMMLLLTNLQAQGYLSVKTEPGMIVYIDSAQIGEGSFSSLPLPSGHYTVWTYDPKSLDWSDRGITEEIQIRENEKLNLDFTLSAQIKINSLPIGSKVYNGKQLLGNTPITFNKQFLNSSSIRLEKDGYSISDLRITPGQNTYYVNLKPLVNRKELVVSRVTDNQNQLKWYKEGLVVTSLLSSWASFYFKRRADETFAKYQRTSDSQQLVELYDQTKRYDTIAEIAIGVSVATLATYFYLLLTD